MHTTVPGALLALVQGAAVAVAVIAPGQHTVAGLVVLTGLLARWAAGHRRAALTVAARAVPPGEPPPAPAGATPA